MEPRNSILHLAPMFSWNNNIYEGGTIIKCLCCFCCCRDEQNTVCSWGTSFDSFFRFEPLDLSQLFQEVIEKMQQSNCFGVIWQTYAITLELQYNMPSWIHGKLGRHMPMKYLSLVHHTMMTWTMGLWAVSNMFIVRMHWRKGEMVPLLLQYQK